MRAKLRTKQAVKHYGSKAKLARALGISRQSISDWGDEVPEGRAYQLEVMTNGALKAPRVTAQHRTVAS